jgi:hypothetical protein
LIIHSTNKRSREKKKKKKKKRTIKTIPECMSKGEKDNGMHGENVKENEKGCVK